MANIFAEEALATELISMDVVKKLMDTAHTVSTYMKGENYTKAQKEVFFALCNLITECDSDTLH